MLVGAHLPRATGKTLKQLALDEDTTIRALLEEAISALLKARGREIIKALPDRPPGVREN